eukprot:CAMPEP_0203753196 /NCGR_PEP_ID=MMETSP0098-20131031/7000_1 /ASSEMBLY_ACC=CAM_ASM_000208 /TAXON_ID=96639 /ORGANISM=" , Strain NY0313808BC1" /LENGTH=983 /DNA_ID=CAMNT_0050643683 /DNA_START=133 /DNA_END=3080 /DNA_ORIENTATION=+
MERVVFRDAQDLYTNLSADNVWLVLKSTKDQVETKQEEVRELISLRYHDLIDSADAIVGMDKTVNDFQNRVSEIEKYAKSLLEAESTLSTEWVKPKLKSLKKLASIGEMATDEDEAGVSCEASLMQQAERADVLTLAAVNIWESIDSKRLWEACEIYLEAAKAYKELEKYDGAASSTIEFAKPDPDACSILGIDTPSFVGTRQIVHSESKGDVTIWEIYPYLRSHWSLVQEARKKILNEARLVLNSGDTSVDATYGSIRAMILLGDVTPEASCERLLTARMRTIEKILSEKEPESLVKSMILLQQTIVDVGDLYVLGSPPMVSTVDNAKQLVSEWIMQLGKRTPGMCAHVLSGVTNVDDLFLLQQRTREIESSGGASVDAASEMDFASWEKAFKSCVDEPIWNGQQAAGGVFLYPMLLEQAFVNRAVEILGRSFIASCEELQNGIENTLESLGVSHGDINAGLESSGVFSGATTNDMEEGQEEVSVEENETALFSTLGKLVLSEDAVDRARAATVLVYRFDNSTLDVVSRRDKLQLGDNLSTSLAKACESMLATVAWLENKVEHHVALIQNMSNDPELLSTMDEEIKKVAFLARLAEAITISDGLGHLLTKDALQEKYRVLDGISVKMHQIWDDSTLLAGSNVLTASLSKEDWGVNRDWRRLHSGWERVPISLNDGGNENHNDDYDLGDAGLDADLDDKDDSVVLPGTVSPGVALFSFLLSKRIRLIGDSRFISSGSILATTISDLLQVDYSIQGDSEEGFASAAVVKFCKSNEKAILKLSDHALSFVAETYGPRVSTLAANEPGALQTYFDLQWFEWLLFVNNEPKDNLLPDICDELVSVHIDPIDWTIYEPLLNKRVVMYRERNALLFGPNLIVKSQFEKSTGKAPTDTLSTPATYDTNNILHLGYMGNKTLPRVPLLPIPSTMRTMRHKLAIQRKRASSNRSISSAASPTNATSSNAEDGSSTLNLMGQVGSNLFSQASS